jgi:hypothetical protein
MAGLVFCGGCGRKFNSAVLASCPACGTSAADGAAAPGSKPRAALRSTSTGIPAAATPETVTISAPTDRSTQRLMARMSALSTQPLLTAMPINVAWLDTVVGALVIVSVPALIWIFVARSFVTSIAVVAVWFAVETVAWLALRRQGGPLRLGVRGGIAATSDSTIFIAREARWGGPPTLIGSWPRSSLTVTGVERIGPRRLFTVEFAETHETATLETRGKNRDAHILDVFGPATPDRAWRRTV